jgi:hypothetical protein
MQPRAPVAPPTLVSSLQHQSNQPTKNNQTKRNRSRNTAWRCFLAGVCSTFMMAQLNPAAGHGMIGFSGVRELANRDWLMQARKGGVARW